MTTYVSFLEINDVQLKIMKTISLWVHEQKTPIPRKEVIIRMKEQNIKEATTIKSLGTLIRKGYIRPSYEVSNKTYYVQLRSV